MMTEREEEEALSLQVRKKIHGELKLIPIKVGKDNLISKRAKNI